MNLLFTTMGGQEKWELIYNILSEYRYSFVNKIICCDAQENVITSTYNLERCKFIKVPYSTEDNYLSELNKICEENKVDIIFSIDSYESILLSNYAKEYSYLKNVKLTCSDNLSFDIHLNKSDYLKLFEDEKFYLIEASLSDRLRVNDLDNAVHHLQQAGYTQIIMKPNNSHGSRGVRVIDLKYSWDKYIHEKEAYYISYKQARDLIEIAKDDILIQPFYSGQNYNVDCYLNPHGSVIYPVIHKVMGNRWGQVTASEIVSEKSDKKLFDFMCSYAFRISNVLRLNKNFNFELSTDPTTGELKLVEVNPRISAVIPQSMHTESDLIYLSIIHEYWDKFTEFEKENAVKDIKNRKFQSVFITLKQENENI